MGKIVETAWQARKFLFLSGFEMFELKTQI